MLITDLTEKRRLWKIFRERSFLEKKTTRIPTMASGIQSFTCALLLGMGLACLCRNCAFWDYFVEYECLLCEFLCFRTPFKSGCRRWYLSQHNIFSISKRLRLLGNFFLPHYPASHQDYFTNLTLIVQFAEFNESNFIISIRNWFWNTILLHCDRIHSQNNWCCFWTI